MSDPTQKKCQYCSEPIQLDEVFGWYHGNIEAGWNTSCADDENRAWPTDGVEPDEKEHIWRCNDVVGGYLRVLLWDREVKDGTTLAFIEEQTQAVIISDHKHVFTNQIVSVFRDGIYHNCPGKIELENKENSNG